MHKYSTLATELSDEDVRKTALDLSPFEARLRQHTEELIQQRHDGELQLCYFTKFSLNAVSPVLFSLYPASCHYFVYCM